MAKKGFYNSKIAQMRSAAYLDGKSREDANDSVDKWMAKNQAVTDILKDKQYGKNRIPSTKYNGMTDYDRFKKYKDYHEGENDFTDGIPTNIRGILDINPGELDDILNIGEGIIRKAVNESIDRFLKNGIIKKG